MAAVRAVLLSDIQSVLSLARHQYGYLISNTTSLETEDESPVSVLQSLLTLRGRLLYCYDVTELSPLTVIKPFLDVIRHHHTSSAVTSASLQALLSFVQLWPWVDVQDENVAADTVSDIVDAVSHCRFQAESIEGDQNALVLVAHVLHAVMRSPYGARLSDHSMWQLVQSLYALNRGSQYDSRVTLPLRSTAMIFLHDTVTFVFSNHAIYADSASAAITESSPGTGFGLPCAVKIMSFLCQKLHQRNDSSSPNSDAAVSSTGSTIRQREVLLSFNLLECALVACDAELITGVPSLMFFIKDDLCKAVLRYCRLGCVLYSAFSCADLILPHTFRVLISFLHILVVVCSACAEQNISIVCLKIIRLLWSKLRSEIKMQIEAIFDGIFYHTLHWCLSNMNVNNPDFPRGDDVALSVENVDSQRDGKPAALVESALDDFTGNMLSKVQLYSISFEIFDCLVDLLAEATLLTDLYVNYDCDDNRRDLTQTLFGLLSQVAQQSHVACFESHEESHFLWAQAIGEIALRGLFNSLHVVYTRTQQNVPVLGGDDSSGSSDNEDALVIEEDEECLLAGAELVSAVALYKKQKRKKFFQRGIQEFNRKPLAGIKYLQQNGFLPIPLDSKSFAKFLRSLPQDLSKTSVGVYLGAIGKEVKGFEKSDIHEADTIDFHRDVLTNFVRSFNFEGESIVTALRMFLASFRLPGEAQQIDRILNAFSLQVYEQCRERFVMASMDVAYLLSFSLIMLNTDLHNPNIRGDKKMKLADFIKNNKNYGHEVSNGLDLPEDFLAELYNAIANEEIRTFEDGGKHGEVTSVRWKDLLNRAESDPRNSRLIMLRPSLRFQSLRAPCSIGAAESSASPPVPGVMQSMTQTRRVTSVFSPTNGAAEMHESDTTWKQQDELKFRYASSGDQYDRHIYELVQQNLVRAFSSVFQQFVVDSQARDAARGEDLSVGSGYEMHYVPQKSALQFACNGLVLCATVAYHLSLVEYCNSVFVRLCKYTALLSSDIYPVGYNGRENGARVYCDNQSAPVATAAVLKLLSTCSLLLCSRSWKYFFHVVNGLREFHVVPSRVLYPSDDMKSELMTAKERLVFIDLVYQNKEKLDRKIALSAQDEDGGNGDAGGFFSSVAWLLSAIDSSVGSSASTSGTTTSSQCSPWYQLSPAELASHADDLIVGEDAPATHTFDSEHDLRSELGTDQWIRTSLEPYRLDFFVQDVAGLPHRVLAEVIEGLCDGLHQTLQDADAQKYRKEAAKLALSQGGCVLFEHLLCQIISLSGPLSNGDAAGEKGRISAALEAHIIQHLELLRPMLLSNNCSSRMTYENACFLLYKLLNTLFAWATCTRGDANRLPLENYLFTFMEMSADDEFVRPFLTPVMCGLNRYVTMVQPSNLHYSRMDWEKICSLISLSVKMPHAASHAFELLEQLVINKVWDRSGNEKLIRCCYTKMIMFAIKRCDPYDSWTPSRPIKLLCFMFDALYPDSPDFVIERLRFLGGMTVISKQLLLNQAIQEISNGLVPAAFEALTHMLREHAGSEQSFQSAAWLDILRYGLLPIGYDLLNDMDPNRYGRAVHVGNDEEENSSPFLYYRRQLASFDEDVLPSILTDVSFPNDTSGTAGRRRRSSILKDPLALRPHVVVVQLVSLVVCEELTNLQMCPEFLAVWENVCELLVGLLEHTVIDSVSSSADGPASDEVAIATLERRSVLSAHEEILEHSKGIVRRLAVLQDEIQKQNGAKEQETPKLEDTFEAGQLDVLMQVLEDKCRSNSTLLKQLFPVNDDTMSIGGCTPRFVETSGEIFEEQSDNDVAT